MSQLTVFYDGGCPLCRREIAHYRRVDAAGRVRWVDITSEAAALAQAGVDQVAAMRRLHACKPDGSLVTGVSAFVAIWRRLPRYRWLARTVEALRLVPLMERVYVRFADRRFERRCRDGACALPPRH
jgi:predicted DCC family thiol-disulfide oxidoreductase YuxK